ncbi:MAG: hydantoinase/oxoprolinase family protein, partial [Deltaproteobacteria bacterium]|nr:hydantoinase/oxoprolinase family protein [Deltaproteobacteria bacterium]
ADKPKPLIPRSLIRGVTERIDSLGDVLIPLREEDVRETVKDLIDLGVEGIAVGLLWSFLNPVHELRCREIIYEIDPDMAVSLSHEVMPIVREYPRFISCIIDLYIGKPLKMLLQKIEQNLKEYGYKKPLLVMQAIGGVSQSSVVKPATTLHSGPVGGLIGVNFLKNIYGYNSAVGSDVGGTSFDITASVEGQEEFLREPVVGRFEIANPMREIITIGAGGGTIAWIEPITKSLRVGPQSAGSDPGPVCYDRGGTEPTATDADLVMNRIDGDYFLGGKIRLDRERALNAIEEKIAGPLGIDVFQAAEYICEILDGHMSAALKSTISQRGVDPGKSLLVCFGGAAGAHCAGYSKGQGFDRVVIPPYASVFSAFGASTSDIIHRYEASPFVTITNLPYDIITLKFEIEKMDSLGSIPSRVIERFNRMFDELEKKAISDLRSEGFNKEQITLKGEMLARYGGQLWEVRCPCPVRRLNSTDDLKVIVEAFEEEYLRQYTSEVMAPAGGMEILTVVVVGMAETVKPELRKEDHIGEDPRGALKGEREVYFGSRWIKTKTYEMDRLQVGNVIEGPGIIEGKDTVLAIPADRIVTVDEYGNMILGELKS